MYFAGLRIYYKMLHGPYNIKVTIVAPVYLWYVDCFAAWLLLTGADDVGLRNLSAEWKMPVNTVAAVLDRKLCNKNMKYFISNINLTYM